jgi:flagellar basal-body rod protein FlgB
MICAMILDRTAGALERYMDVLSQRQKTVAANIANVDTPGYKTRDLVFRGDFQALLGSGPVETVDVAGLTTKNDGNNVSLDREARLLAENALRFNLASNLLRSEIRQVRSAIDEGRNG